MTERLNTILPADMKFENAPLSVVAERLEKATGIGVNFVSATSGQTLTADLGNQRLMAALKTLSEHYNGAIVLTMKREGNRTDQIMLQLGTANRARAVKK